MKQLTAITLALAIALVATIPAYAGSCSFWQRGTAAYVSVNGTALLYHGGRYVRTISNGTYRIVLARGDKLYSWRCR